MNSDANPERACPHCGTRIPAEAASCTHCVETTAKIRTEFGTLRELWESPSGENSDGFEPRIIPQFGRYRDLEFLGAGGMGRVYKAIDPTLHRTVALKFIRGDDPELKRRLLTEARLQARLDHENVCKVHEVGDVDGRLYIAMQYLRGKSLNAAASEMNLDEKVRVIKRVAEGVHEAHRAGLIHRDLKPANIMVEQNEEGHWIPCIMDFGLARVQESAGMTASGLIMGSPDYMSPEQARGEVTTLDRRSDVYSLGATFYELLCGKRLFDETTGIQVILNVLNEDPAPLRERDKTLPQDLETIVMKCLEKDPERRYPSARALSEDLQKYLDGDPISAHPAGFFYRIRKKAAKHKALAAAILGSAIVVLVSLAVMIRAQLHAREQARLAQRVGIEVTEIESLLRNIHTMPLHNITRERKSILDRMKAIESQAQEMGNAGYGPYQYALGKGYLDLQEVDLACKHLRFAWQAGYRDSAVAYALGQAMGILYDRELERVRFLDSKKEEELERIRKEYREPALQYLKMSKDTGTDPPAYVQGLIAFYDGRFDAALADSEKALQEVPWLYEAKKLQGDIYALQGELSLDSGKLDLSANSLESAGKAYDQAINMARSDPALYVSRCAQGVLTLELEMERGAFPEPVLKQAIAACDNALTVLPEQAEAYEKKGWAYSRYGEYLTFTGGDAATVLRMAIDFGSRATRLNPALLEAWMRLAAAYNTLGEYESAHGEDPRQDLQQAIASSDAILKINPNHPYATNLLGYAALTMAEYEIDNALDPRASLKEAIRGFEKTTRTDPKFAKGFNNLGYTYLTRGVYETEHGLDARASLQQAIRGFQDAIRINPSYAAAYGSLGLTRVRLAQSEIQQGRDPLVYLNEMRKDCEASLKLNPQFAYTFNILGLSNLVAAQYRLQEQQDPSGDVEEGIHNLQKALEYKRDSENARVNLIRIYRVKGERELMTRRSPAQSLSDARSLIKELQSINPKVVPPLSASLDLLEARFNASRGTSPLALLDRAARTVENPVTSDDFELLAEIFAERAAWEQKHGIDSSASARSGTAAAESALRINPLRAKSQAVRRSLQAGSSIAQKQES